MGLVLWLSPAAGRDDEARRIADDYLAAIRAYGSPRWTALALAGSGRAFADTDPDRALAAYREALGLVRGDRQVFQEAGVARDAAELEAVHGRLDDALELLDTTIAAFHRGGDHLSLPSPSPTWQ
jgi:hypothetical protein